ncbi:MAG: alanyl-tRNA editing protein [Thermoprotei archaeon]
MDLGTFASGVSPTKKLYLDNSYMRSCEAAILKYMVEKNYVYIALDQTIFHPQGGGQPSDVGIIRGEKFEVHVKRAMEAKGVVVHWGWIEGNIKSQEKIICEIDWLQRYYNMKLHTAGHVIDYAVMKTLGNPVTTISANHGPHAYIEYLGDPPNRVQLKNIEEEANKIVRLGKTVKVLYVKREELSRITFNAPNLLRIPQLEIYRIIMIEGVNAMPCGGTHVNNTKEIEEITIKNVEDLGTSYKLHYDVR